MELLKKFLTETLSGFGLSENLVSLLTSISVILVWVLLGMFYSRVTKIIVKRLKSREKQQGKRNKTISALVFSLLKYLFWFIIVMMILKDLGIDLGPVLASAGILGFAVGFGAQELIKDLISGFFIVFENAFLVGDVIEINGFKGTVIEVGLRRTKIVNFKNEIRLVNNGDIKIIDQYSIGISVGVIDIQVTPNFDLNLFRSDAFNDILEKHAHYEVVVEAPKYVGVIASQLFNTTVRITFKTLNNKQFDIERALREDILAYIKDQRDLR